MSAWLRYSCECLVQVDAGCRCLCECCMSARSMWSYECLVQVDAGCRCLGECWVEVFV